MLEILFSHSPSVITSCLVIFSLVSYVLYNQWREEARIKALGGHAPKVKNWAPFGMCPVATLCDAVYRRFDLTTSEQKIPRSVNALHILQHHVSTVLEHDPEQDSLGTLPMTVLDFCSVK
jgi:hypothetical protein